MSAARTIQKKIWRCDVCKAATFESLEAATEHETDCKVHPMFTKQQPNHKRIGTTTTKARKKPKKEKPPVKAKKDGTLNFLLAGKTKKENPKPVGDENVVMSNENGTTIDENQVLEQQRELQFYSERKEEKKKAPVPRSRPRKSWPRFPVPSHVCSFNEQETPPVPPTWTFRSSTVDSASTPLASIPLSSFECGVSSYHHFPGECLQLALAEALVPSKKQQHDRLFVDQFYRPLNTHAEDQLQAFIERFMVRRKAALDKAALRHQKLSSKRVRKKQKKKHTFGDDYDDDDDLWQDEDERARAEATLCLLTGPVGCAKSSTVHRVAVAAGCATVLELHPGQARGGSQLRKLLQESTQSHSSKDLFQKQHVTAEKKGSLVDSDDDEEEGNNTGSSVTVILLDEADTVFETDTGFWSTVLELARKSKCPLVLTANTIPAGLTSGYTHIEMDRPSIHECSAWMQRVATDAGFQVTGDLEKVARWGQCDMRRILCALDVFALRQATLPRVERSMTDAMEWDTSHAIHVDSVEPRSLLADEVCVLTIRGRNFSRVVSSKERDETGGYPCRVTLGTEECPKACVIDDTTLLAVFQPYKLPSYLQKTGLYKGTQRRSLAAAHPHINVASLMGASSEGAVDKIQLQDGSSILQCGQRCTLDVQFPGSIPYAYSPQKKIADDEEHEFGQDSPADVMAIGSYTSKGDAVVDDRRATLLLRKRVDAMRTEHPMETMISCTINQGASADTMNEIERTCQLTSDAAFICDHQDLSVPFLAGACRGFGFDFTDEFPKRPSEERLFAEGYKDQSYFYGDSDAYVTHPNGTVERRLLNSALLFSRSACTVQDFSSATAEDEGDVSSPPWDDMLLVDQWPGCIATPNDIIGKSSPCWSIRQREHEEVQLKREARRKELLSLLENNFYAGEYGAPYYLKYQVMNRSIDPTIEPLPQNTAMLDYLPLLRCMVVTDQARRTVMPKEESTRRRTRRSAKGPVRYLDNILPDYVRRVLEDSELAELEGILKTSALFVC